MKWSERFATGIERIDAQHKMLFKMTEDYLAALDLGAGGRVYGVLLQSLDVYARGHFGFEEGCMDRCRCPAAQANRADHVRFMEVLAGFQERYAQRGFDEVEARELIDTLDQWLENHIGSIDIQLKKRVQEP